jgi:DNA-binding MarR family transcriptional regulator
MQSKQDMTFGKSLSVILRHGQMYLDRELKPINIRAAQIAILGFLGIKDGVSQERIRRYLHLDKGTIAKSIRPLIKEGYINRVVNPEDRRAYQVFLTQNGRDIIPDLKNAVMTWTDILTADFTEEEKEMAHNLLSRMSDNAHEYLKNQISDKD